MGKRPSAIVVGVGAERGLGAALCCKFAAQGYHVFVAGRTVAKIDQVTNSIVAAGGSAVSVATDTTDEGAVISLFDMAFSESRGHESPDLVVFNAGNNRRIDFRELTAA